MADDIQTKVANTAESASKNGSPYGNGMCWGFVHHVLATVNAKSFYDFNHQGESDPIFAAWGEPATEPGIGYIIVLKDAAWATIHKHKTGRGTVKSTTITRVKHQFHKHVAIILRVDSDGHLLIAQQGVPSPSAKPSQLKIPTGFKQGTLKYFRPVAMPLGHKTSSPTPASKAAAAN
ncbi:hypothetical protein [Schlesneria paludicola]|uniref:hypothetical protein n=1 Tax=Schlesneria paludicola TaxID=360056 RepID=UPI00029A452F|nr:hypothetical protein [Schlesneria paludicola]